MVDDNTIAEESEEIVGKSEEQEARELDFILDIPLELSVELGKTRMLVNDLLQLGQGSIIELNKLAGEPLEVYINRKLIARGEVVVVNEKFGVRLTDVITPIDRVKSLAAEDH
ncbi:MAG: flagellar motor switch protein FliN [Proteobacteria bacterium]|nr:flagellar motor switch protein FliN [Desulfobacula sp.]MBU3953418.1 flagellar motor switch protein FliN [Pseudomonadota bacterium]MBU4130878.1 flagellar motor switch protein FliN [Pseudomonadota bacterium]